MKKPTGTFVGRVTSDAKTLTGKTGKQTIVFTLEGDEQTFGEKRYRQRVDIKLVAKEPEYAMLDIKAGALVCVSGDVSSNVYESKREPGKWMSTVEIFTFNYSIEAESEAGASRPATKSASVVNQGNPVPRPAAPATPPDADDVPF
jgi:single-stranded DNA-binding protein